MNDKSLKIGKRAFITSFLVLLALMILAGILSQVLPASQFDRVMQDGRAVILPNSYQLITAPDIPLYRILTAPFEVLLGKDAAIVVVIIVFLLLMAGSFSLLLDSGLIAYIMDKLIAKFYNRRYLLMSVVSLVFMSFGATFGIFEEIIILVPFCILLAKKFGWDSLTGLGISLLSVGIGFGTAIFNPFTLGVAQELAELPIFSAALYRVAVFISFYVVLQIFLRRYVAKIENDASASLVFADEVGDAAAAELAYTSQSLVTAKIFGGFLVAIVALFVASFFSAAISSLLFILVGFVFALGAIVSVSLSGALKLGAALKKFGLAMLGVLPAVLLILMAMSIKLIMERAQVLDTILYQMQLLLRNLGPIQAVFALYVLVLIMNFFIGSGSAKAFLLIPLLLPLTDLLGVNRQIAVQAFVFGDGTSNLLYPTNAALMIALGFSIVSYPKWLRWTYKLQLVMAALAIFWLSVAYLINLGPF